MSRTNFYEMTHYAESWARQSMGEERFDTFMKSFLDGVQKFLKEYPSYGSLVESEEELKKQAEVSEHWLKKLEKIYNIIDE